MFRDTIDCPYEGAQPRRRAVPSNKKRTAFIAPCILPILPQYQAAETPRPHLACPRLAGTGSGCGACAAARTCSPAPTPWRRGSRRAAAPGCSTASRQCTCVGGRQVPSGAVRRFESVPGAQEGQGTCMPRFAPHSPAERCCVLRFYPQIARCLPSVPSPSWQHACAPYAGNPAWTLRRHSVPQTLRRVRAAGYNQICSCMNPNANIVAGPGGVCALSLLTSPAARACRAAR